MGTELGDGEAVGIWLGEGEGVRVGVGEGDLVGVGLGDLVGVGLGDLVGVGLGDLVGVGVGFIIVIETGVIVSTWLVVAPILETLVAELNVIFVLPGALAVKFIWATSPVPFTGCGP